MVSRHIRLAALERQAARLTRHIDVLQAASRRYTWARLAIFLAAIFICAAFFDFMGSTAGWVSVALALAIFGVVVYFHRRITQSIQRHMMWMQIKQTHIARMRLDWPHIPAPSLYPRSDHPFDADLDITGEHSIHRLLDTAVSVEGSQRLYTWLTSTAPDITAIQRRQALVSELAHLPRFCDRLTLHARLAAPTLGRRWSSQHLLDWLQQQPTAHRLRPALLALIPLSLANIILYLLYQNGSLPPLWLATFAVYALISLTQLSQISVLFGEALALNALLNNLQAVFSGLEQYHYGANPRLKNLCQPFLDPQQRPSTLLRKINGVLAGASLQQNPILRLAVNAIIPWDVYFAYRLDQQKRTLQRLMPDWLHVWHELEALSSLATFAYLNPAFVFPEIGEPVGEGLRPSPTQVPLFSARQIGHPLIPDGERVNNDFSIESLGEVTIITGSNMSGKSSFLRALGVNLCLAYAGGVVCAEALHVPVFRLFTCIRVSDSVTDGISYFYAEVKRLKALLDNLQADHALPLFFLIDEIFRGTNNYERLIGSRAYIQALVGGNGIGLISTHDLELVKMADEIPQITNDHFEESVSGGAMVFDYQLRPGPSPTTNALKIMAMEGLPIPRA